MDEKSLSEHRLQRALDSLRLRSASPNAVFVLSVLGVLVGLLSGAVIILFRLLVESAQAGLLPGGDAENYEALAGEWRLLLPLLGGLALGLIFHYLQPGTRRVGPVHVIERLHHHQGRMPLRNALAQFIGAGISIFSGHSVGREGPSIHLGAAAGSGLAQWLTLPNNSSRTLVACGTAAAIATSFNTPLAGVIFAMEVVMMEYSVISFIPVILATVSGTTLAIAVFGTEPAFRVPSLELGSLLELPFIVFVGVAIGVLAAILIQLLKATAGYTRDWPVLLRFGLAGLLTGLIAIAVPEVMSIGYDTVNEAMLGEMALGALGLILAAKLLATALALGLGLPGGLIGPLVFLGAIAGGTLAAMGVALFTFAEGGDGFYAMLGMGAMMGATLQAPLAALTAVLEMTNNPNIILPAMLAIVSASLTTRVVFGKDSVFRELLVAQGMDVNTSPVMQRLRSIGVTSIMDRSLVLSGPTLSQSAAALLLQDQPHWLLVVGEDQPAQPMPAIDLRRAVEEMEGTAELCLWEIPANRLQSVRVTQQSSLQEAFEALEREQAEAVLIEKHAGGRILGLITRDMIERAYHN